MERLSETHETVASKEAKTLLGFIGLKVINYAEIENDATGVWTGEDELDDELDDDSNIERGRE